MSDDLLRLIPTDPGFVPSAEAQNKVLQLLNSLGQWADKISLKSTDQVTFVDQGSNFERVLCPRCEWELEIDWWQQAMSKAYETQFIDLDITLPCCGTKSSLNTLTYQWPAGFARFIIEILNPQKDTNEDMMQMLEKALGCRLRKIVAHY